MAVIKSTASKPGFAGTSLYDLSDLRLTAERTLAEARAEAERLIAGAKREVERIYSESRESGFEQGQAEGYATGLAEGRAAGEAAGRADARAEHQAMILALEQSLSTEFGRWMAAREEIMRQAERELAKIAILIAESVVRTHVSAEPSAIERQVETAVALFARATRVSIEIAPEDEILVRDALPNLCAMLPVGAEISLRAVSGIARGGCVVRSSEGTVDARIETQFRRVREALLGSPTAADVTGELAVGNQTGAGQAVPAASVDPSRESTAVTSTETEVAGESGLQRTTDTATHEVGAGNARTGETPTVGSGELPSLELSGDSRGDARDDSGDDSRDDSSDDSSDGSSDGSSGDSNP
jgi:flagellar assembly protein FliH